MVTLLSWLIVILIVVALFKITGFVFHIVGKMLGFIFGIAAWLILAGLAVTVFGLAMFCVPVILIVGCLALIAAAT
jgi:hypothetical protein